MEIIVGSTPRVGGTRPLNYGTGGTIEAKLLNVRPSRKRNSISKKKDRRYNKTVRDHQSGRVMVLLVADEQNIPADLNSENYRVMLRFVPRKK